MNGSPGIEGLLERIDGVNKKLEVVLTHPPDCLPFSQRKLMARKLNLLESIVRLIYERGGEK